MYTHIKCLHRLFESGYLFNYKSLFDFLLFDMKRKDYPLRLRESIFFSEYFYSSKWNESNNDVKKNKIKIFYDITRLLTHNNYTGISLTTWKLYIYLSKINFCDIILVYNKDYILNSNLINLIEEKYEFDIFNASTRVTAFDYRVVVNRITSPFAVYHSSYFPIPSDLPPNIKKVITLYDIIHLTHKNFYPDPSKFITGKIAESCRTADMTLSISDFTTNQIVEYLGEEIPILTMPLAPTICPEDMKSSLHDSSSSATRILTFAYQGGDPRKKFNRMFNIALKWLASDQLNTVCIFGDTVKLLKNFQEEISLKSAQVRLVQTPSESDLANLLHNSSVYLYLSEAEGFGLPPLEAMRFGCPPIILKNSSLEEVFMGWEGMLDNNASDDEILEKINDFVGKKGIREAAKKFSSVYTWESACCLAVAGYIIATSEQANTSLHGA